MNNLYIGTSKIHGVGVFTKVNIPDGTRMFLVADFKERFDNKSSVTELGRYVNHKRNANCEFTEEDDNRLVYLRSLENINKGES